MLEQNTPDVTLSEFKLDADITIIRDGSFKVVGKIPTKLKDRLVPINSKKFIECLKQKSGIRAVLCPEELLSDIPDNLAVATADDPVQSAYIIHELLCKYPSHHWRPFKTKIHESARIHPSASIDANNVSIGPRTIIRENTVIYPRTIIDSDCDIGPNTVIGVDDFQTIIMHGIQRLLPQAGGVWIGKHVQIQANVIVGRATFGGFTKINDESIISHQVHIAHDCTLGKRVKIAASAEISGRVTIGKNSYIGPNSTISNGLTIGENTTITLGAVVTKDVANSTRVSGNFAIDHKKWLDFIRSISE